MCSPITHDDAIEAPLLAEDVADDRRVLRDMRAIHPVVPVQPSVNNRNSHDASHTKEEHDTYAVMYAHGCAYFSASMNGIK